MKQLFLIVFVTFLAFTFLSAQNVKTPRPSPDALVTQTVGVTDITIEYSSPGVKERKIWGELVPFNEIWRTGANEVTTITFEDDVKVNGNELKAGTYGIHTIPGENEWQIIFSGDTKVGDGSTFDEKKEVLRLKVKPEQSSFLERMTFMFTNTTDNSTTTNLVWENLKVSFNIEANTQELTLSKAKENISWLPTFQAANYCLQNDVNLEQAMKWIEASVLLNEVYWNTRIKAQIQQKLGMNEDAVSTMEKAILLGAEMDEPPFDYDRMKEMLSSWK